MNNQQHNLLIIDKRFRLNKVVIGFVCFILFFGWGVRSPPPPAYRKITSILLRTSIACLSQNPGFSVLLLYYRSKLYKKLQCVLILFQWNVQRKSSIAQRAKCVYRKVNIVMASVTVLEVMMKRTAVSFKSIFMLIQYLLNKKYIRYSIHIKIHILNLSYESKTCFVLLCYLFIRQLIFLTDLNYVW